MRPCETCDKPFAAATARARFCSAQCRVKAHRAKGKPSAVVVALAAATVAAPKAAQPGILPPDSDETVETSVRLALVERTRSPLGRQCLLLARRMDAGVDPSGSAFAAVSRQLTALLVQVLAESDEAARDVIDDVDDEVSAMRARHEAG